MHAPCHAIDNPGPYIIKLRKNVQEMDRKVEELSLQIFSLDCIKLKEKVRIRPNCVDTL